MALISYEDAVGSPPSPKDTTSKSGLISYEDAVGETPATQQQDKPTGSSLHAGVRAAGEAVVPGAAGLTGAVAGATAIAPLAAYASVLSGPAGPIVGGALELFGAGAGAFIGAEGVGWVQDKLHQLIAPDDYVARKAEREQYPTETMIGGVAGGAVGLSPKAGFDPAAKFINTAMKARAAAATGQAGVSAGTQYATKGEVDLGETALAGATGFALPGVNPLGRPFAALGERLAGKGAAVKPVTRDTADTKDKVDVKTTPEQDAEFETLMAAEMQSRKLKAKEEAEGKSPLKQAAIINKETGEIELMGPKHDQARKDATKDTHDEGFVDDNGIFHERMDAVDQAKRAGQIPEDHVLESPEGERPGLHSGDLRKAGIKDFEVTPEKPAGGNIVGTVSLKDGSEVSIESISSPNAFGKLVRMEFGEPVSLVAKNKSGKEIGRLTYMPGGGPIGVEVQEGNRRKGVGTALYNAHKAAGGKLLPLESGAIISDEARALRASIEPKPPTVSKIEPEELARINGLTKYDINKEIAQTNKQIERLQSLNSTDSKVLEAIADHQTQLDALESTLKAKEAAPESKDDVIAEWHSVSSDKKHPILQTLRSAKNVNDVYKIVSDHLGKDHFASILMGKLQSRFKGFEVKFLTDKEWTDRGYSSGWAAATDFTNKQLAFREGKFTLESFVHEPLHEATSIELDVNPEFKAEIEALRIQAINSMGGIKNIRTKERMISAVGTPDEFVAYGLSNASAIKHLSSIPSGKTNVLTKFVDSISKALGFTPKEKTAFHDLLDAVERGLDTTGKTSVVDGKPVLGMDIEKLAEKTTPEVAKEAEKVDPRSVPNKEEMIKHATDIHEKYGPEEAKKFFQDWNKDQKERSIPVPKDEQGLDDALHKIDTFQTADKSEHVTEYLENSADGITPAMREESFIGRELGVKTEGKLGETLDKLDSDNKALVRKIKGMGGDVGEEFVTGQSRIRIRGGGVTSNWKEMLKELFANRTPLGEKVADQANAAMERTVYQLDDGRVIELHRQSKNAEVQIKDKDGKVTGTRKITKGTEVWEWKDNKKKMIYHTDNLEFKRGDKFSLGGKEHTVVDAKVPSIEEHSPYKYLKDSEASARLANMALRKMSRDLELINNLKQSDLFKRVAHGPDDALKDLPAGWKVPENIDKIPQLRGYHFDPKTAAIIEDFAKVWDNTMWMKLSNQVVKNMMLNPVPHMFNEVMHLFNARGFTGWVPLTGGWSRLGSSGAKAWRDVGQQTQFYRDIMREGGSILGADPRNNYFEEMQKHATKQYLETPENQGNMKILAKKLGTSVGDLYNGISKASQKAMWFTRDLMYVQYVHEVMGKHEKRTGTKMELKDAIQEVERHMPNYRMPSEVLGSRGLSKVLKNPNISMFSRYHYGMVKSLVNTMKDMNPQNLTSVEGRRHFRDGVDSMLAIGVAMAAIYPMMDSLAQVLFGEGAEQRRAGPYHLIHAGEQVLSGERDASALIWPVFTFNPMLLSLGQAAFNKNIFTGKPIYHPDDPVGDIASDIGSYAAKQIPQVPSLMGAVQEDGGEGKFIAKQLDIKVKTEKQREAERTARKREAAAAKGRIKKREQGTYRP